MSMNIRSRLHRVAAEKSNCIHYSTNIFVFTSTITRISSSNNTILYTSTRTLTLYECYKYEYTVFVPANWLLNLHFLWLVHHTQVPSMSEGGAECCGAGHRTHLLQPAQEDLLQVRLRGVLGATRARRRRMLPPAPPSHSTTAHQSTLLNAVKIVSQNVIVTRGWWYTYE